MPVETPPLPPAPLRQLLPQPAGLTQPVVMRAMEQLRKAYPADMEGVRVVDAPMTDRDAFSSRLASTPIDLGSLDPRLKADQEEITVNPAVSAAFSQEDIESTLAHELEHVRQGRTLELGSRIRQFKLPYEERPDEKAARAASTAYRQQHPPTHRVPPDFSSALHYLQGLFTPSR